MRKTFFMLWGLILATAMIVFAALPGAASADVPSGANSLDYRYCLGIEELGAGATSLTGTISVAEYRARQGIVQTSPVSLDLDLNPIK